MLLFAKHLPLEEIDISMCMYVPDIILLSLVLCQNISLKMQWFSVVSISEELMKYLREQIELCKIYLVVSWSRARAHKIHITHILLYKHVHKECDIVCASNIFDPFITRCRQETKWNSWERFDQQYYIREPKRRLKQVISKDITDQHSKWWVIGDDPWLNSTL